MARSLLFFLSALSLVTANALTVTIYVNGTSACGQATGAMYAYIEGGVPPYTMLWSNGVTTEENVYVPAGWYSITVTDALGTQVTEWAEIVVTPTYTEYLGIGNDPSQDDRYSHCAGSTPYVIPFRIGYFAEGPYTFDVPGYAFSSYTMEGECSGSTGPFVLQVDAPPGSSVPVTMTDGAGCVSTGQMLIPNPIPQPPIDVSNIQGTCTNAPYGSALLTMDTWSGPGGSTNMKIRVKRVSTGEWVPSGCSSYQVYRWNPQPVYLTGLLPGEHEVYFHPEFFSLVDEEHLGCAPITTFPGPDLGTDCGVVTGTVFVDNNQNCSINLGEPRVPGMIIEALPGPWYGVTNDLGTFAIAMPPGAYTLEQQSTVLAEHCVGAPIPVTVDVWPALSTVQFPDTSLVDLDAMIALGSGLARPGFQFQYAMTVRNLTPTLSGAVTVTLTIDPVLGFVSATPNPTSVVGNVITWTQSQLTAWEERTYQVVTQVPPDVGLLGTVLTATAQLSTANADGDLTNNTATNDRIVTGSYDPNDKLATTTSGSSTVWDLDADEWIDYTIRFQNTGTDTAFNILITDTLPAVLDAGSLQVGTSSHVHTWELTGQGILKFRFTNILLPDSNVNEPRSHGFVTFRIRPHLPILPGTTITNIANIYFDFNPPIITEPSVLVAEFSTGIQEAAHTPSGIIPNPAADRIRMVDPLVAARARSWSIIAMDGRIVRSGKGPFPSEGIDVTSLRSGTYALQLQLGTNVIHERFVKNTHE
ncbi:MAG: T9SS type A sorting domain-containing protein [Flavobacteriales bacterium]